MRFLNLTPHPITIVEGDQSTAYQVDGPAPRLSVERESLGQLMDTSSGHHDGGSHYYDEEGMPWPCPSISVVRSTMGDPTGLPEPQDGVIVIVSALVAEHPSLATRNDLAYPGEAIRDTDGKIVGCRGLCAGPGLAELLSATEFVASCGGDRHDDNGEFTIGTYLTFQDAKQAAEELMEVHHWAYFYGAVVRVGSRMVWCRHGHWADIHCPLA